MQALPPESARTLFEWAFRQARPFTVAEAIAGAGIAGAGAAAQVPVALAVHPSVAAWGGRYFTARILAARTEFVVTLQPEERMRGVLVDGHRMLPFRPFDGAPGHAVLVAPGSVEVRSATVTVGRDLAELCYVLLGPAACPWKGPGSLAAVPGYRLPPEVWTKRNPPLQLRLRCTDWDRRTYAMVRWYRTRDHASHDQLMDAMEDVLEDPPPGPRFAARQILQALARCFDRLDREPLGPVGPLFSDMFPLAEANGRAVFVADEDDLGDAFDDVPAPVPVDEPLPSAAADPAGPLLAALEAEAARDRGRRRGLDVARLEWDEAGRRIVAGIRYSQWHRTDVVLSLDPPAVPLRGRCACAPLDQTCEHLRAMYEVLARELRVPGSAFARDVRRWLALTPWQVRLRGLDLVLGAAEPERAAAADERVIWRIGLTDYGFNLLPAVQKRTGKGAWSAGKATAVGDLLRSRRDLLSPQDFEVARALGFARPGYGWQKSGLRLDAEDLVEVLCRLAGHPRVFFASGEGPISVEKAALKLAIDALPDGGFRLAASAGATPFRECPRVAIADHGLVACDVAGGRILVMECPARARDLAAEVHRSGGEFPKEAVPELESRLAALEAVAPLDLPQELAGEPVPADPRPVLRLSPRDPSGLDAALRVRPLPGAPAVYPPGDGPARAGAPVDGRRRSALRDAAAELERASAQAEALGLRGWTETAPWTWTTESDEEALALVERAQAAAPDALSVEWPDPKRRLKIVSVSEPDLRVRIEQKNDWFGLDGHVEVDGGRVALASLLAALRDGRRFVQVAPGHWVALAKEFRDRLRQLADLSLPGKSGLEVTAVAAPFVADLVREAGLVKACESWRRLSKRLKDAAALSPEPPRGFRAKLREYQCDGYRWMARLAAWGAGGCLADDMGLGKTVQALALLMDRASAGPALVVAPTSVTSNWLAETARFAPSLRPVLYRETDRRSGAAGYRPGDLVLASYGLVLRDAARLEQVPWGTLILDEAQAVKNSRTQTASAIRRIPAKWRLALTGTPVENHLGDLWSLFRAVSPGLFGSWDCFRDRFAVPIERGRDPGRREALARLVRPFVLRRTKGEVLRELPSRTEIVLRAELSPEERALYDAARLAAAMNFADGSRKRGAEERIQVLAALTRLRQFACHPRLVVPEAPPSSAKLRLLLRTVEELREGRHRALVFSQFTSFLALVSAALDEARVPYRYLDGSTPPGRRDAEIAAFQRGEGDLFLISLKAGGTGLNLTAADYVLHLDPWWNPAVEDQATDRAHRIGQTRPVTVYRLVATDTIEEKILQMHGSKRELIAGVLEGTDQAARLSTDELIALIREGTAAEAAGARDAAVRS